MGDNETISEILYRRKEGTEESNRRPKLGDFFSSLDKISEDEISISATDPPCTNIGRIRHVGQKCQ